MAVVNGPNVPTLTLGKRVQIGTITTSTDALRFNMTSLSEPRLGSLILQAVPVGGTLTAFTADVRISLDGGVTFNPQFPAGGSTIASNTAGLDFVAHPLQNVGLPGVGGEATLSLQTATLTLNTATAVNIFGLMT